MSPHGDSSQGETAEEGCVWPDPCPDPVPSVHMDPSYHTPAPGLLASQLNSSNYRFLLCKIEIMVLAATLTEI